jgi:site-specific recombinase XerD
MLEKYYVGSSTLRRYRIGPLGKYTDALAARLDEQGYTFHSARTLLRFVSHLSHYLLWRGVSDVGQLRPEHIQAFFKDHLPNCSCEGPNSGTFSAMPAAVDHLVKFLRDQGVLCGFESVEVPPDSVGGMLRRYDHYLETIRAMSATSRGLHRRIIKRFLDARHQRLGDLKLEELTAGEVLDYAREALSTPYSSASKTSILDCLRRFLRFLCWERIQSRDLSRVVPSVTHWKLADVPKHLPIEDVRLLLNAPSTSTPVGLRDRAIMMLLALLGLRACEVAALKLEHLHWREGQLTIPRAKATRQRSLPLAPEVAEAICKYLQNGRPKARSRAVFLRHRAPIGPLSSKQVGTIVRKYILQAGIKNPPALGSHVLRHSMATCLVNQGVPMKQISDILGHRSLESTYIYTKVDVRSLSEVSRPFPALKEE